MDLISEKEIKKKIKFSISRSGKASPSYEKRLTNIQWVRDLNRGELLYSKKERQLLIHETDIGEKIFIQYPGKESSREDDNKKPWDFRPKVYIEKRLTWLQDMSFLDIWDIMDANFKKILDSNKIEVFKTVAILFYRMAFMIDHVESDRFNTEYMDLSIEGGIEKEVSKHKSLELPSFYKYNPNKEVLGYLEDRCRTIWGGLSLEAFLFYNDILTWNEDCKYYYRNFIVKDKKDWIGPVGRVNTSLTHMMVVSYFLGYVTFSKVCNGFSRGRGVSPMTNKDVKEYYKEFIFDSEGLF